MSNEKKADLDLRAALLDLIDQHRRNSGRPDLGADVEQVIMEKELSDLGDGEREAELVPLRRKHHQKLRSNS